MTDETELSADEIIEQKAVRLAKRATLLETGEAYPVSVPVVDTIAAVRAAHQGLDVDVATGVTASLAGRIVHSRNTGKLCFAALQSGDGERIQAMLSLDVVGEDALERWKELVDLGDHVFVKGEVITSKRGELSSPLSSGLMIPTRCSPCGSRCSIR